MVPEVVKPLETLLDKEMNTIEGNSGATALILAKT